MEQRNTPFSGASLLKVMGNAALPLLMLAAFLMLLLNACKKDLLATGGTVSGSVYVLGTPNTGDDVGILSEMILLPDLQVQLKNVATNVESAPVTTDVFGRYAFPVQAPGTYTLFWKAQLGWADGTSREKIVIRNSPVFPIPAEVRSAKAAGNMVYGKVLLKDGSSPYYAAELFDTRKTAEVTALNDLRTTTLSGPIHVNASGFYAIAGIPAGNAVIQVKSQATQITRTVSAAMISASNAFDVQLPNSRPEIVDIVTTAGGTNVRTATAGSTIQLTAMTRDVDGDPLQYEWKATNGNGTLTASGATADWKLPNAKGPCIAHLLIRDDRGGYDMKQVTFEVEKATDQFSGRAVEAGSGVPLKDAQVDVGGVTTTTDANGFFNVNAPLGNRYVLNITKRGYVLVSRVVKRGLSGQTWPMVKAQEQSVDPSHEITLVDVRPILEKKQRKGARITVPANALLDQNGNKPQGNLTAYIATLDIGNSESPGDWGAIDAGGKETNLISYGATWVEFLDAAGGKYQLAPGMKALVEMPAPSAMMPAAPANAKLWSYNEKDGYWAISGSAHRSGNGFKGEVNHFSTINTDVEKNDPACLKVLLYPGLPTGVKLRITDPTGAKFSQSFDLVCDAALNAVYRLPSNADVRIQVFNAANTEITNVVLEETPGVALPSNIVNTGPPIPAGHTFWPDAPYDDCHLVVLHLAVSPANPSAFLTFKGEGTNAKATGYYATVDPNSLRLTLGDWWNVNGFTFPGGDRSQVPDNAVRTSYLNDNDLGSGRDMYFLKRANGDVAAYVTNYGAFDQNDANADLASTRTTPGATVCMEFSPVEGQGTTRIVKFFVFAGNGNGAAGVRQLSANLDAYGDKFVPNLCNNCHGGSFSPTVEGAPTFAEVNMGSSFRELDYATYHFPGARLVPNATEIAAFQQQNVIVKGAPTDRISVQPIKDLITGWYAGGNSEDNSFTPAGWQASAAQRGLYQDVVKNSCRTCHVALGSTDLEGDLTWTTYAQLAGRSSFLSDFVLCQDRFMPHAAIAYRNFWLVASPNYRPGVLQNFTGPGWTAIGPCP